EKSTEAACKYLKDAKARFGSWTAAAASYNMGMNGYAKAIDRQKSNNYYDVLLNSETSRYVFRMLAIKAIMESPKTYGFHFRTKDLYAPLKVKSVTIETSVADFADFAAGYNISYKTLKYHNPWLRESFLSND